ncbi:hypothetical protein EJ03DRAFT_44815 [Teratosphaeria nubilosa]|uniref:Rhodopsin domain-containing protein n=1 Tax=Teratosphaeria nubilosa TaxID=161662 RepID=A0A6G1LEN9_9PEZI|nr:hypothetical protein EJ03DRAFT_44815 [Teratosphaeria nubilosa]
MMIARFAVRVSKEGGGLGLDDLLVLASSLFASAVVGLAVWSSNARLIDRHFWDVRPDHQVEAVALIWLGIVFFIAGTCLLRCSVLLFYRRIQADIWKVKWIFAVWVAFGFTLIYSLAIVLALDLTCQPTQALWKAFSASWRQQHEYSCANILLVNLFSGIISTASDALTFLLPCLMLRGLEISGRQKLALYGLFALNVVVVASGAGRTWALFGFSSASRGDITWYGFWIFFWSITEMEINLISVCAPSVRILCNQYLCTPQIEESRNSSIPGLRTRGHPRSGSTLSFGNLWSRRSSGLVGLHRAVFGTGINSMPEAFKAESILEIGRSSENRLRSAPIWTPEGARLAEKYAEQVEESHRQQYRTIYDQPSSEHTLDQSRPTPVVTITCSNPLAEGHAFDHDAARPVRYSENQRYRSVANWPLPGKKGLSSRISTVQSPSDERTISS